MVFFWKVDFNGLVVKGDEEEVSSLLIIDSYWARVGFVVSGPDGNTCGTLLCGGGGIFNKRYLIKERSHEGIFLLVGWSSSSSSFPSE